MEYLKKLDDMQGSSCSCERCQSTCLSSPCIPRPKEFHAIVENGLKNKFAPTLWLNIRTGKLYTCIAPKGTGWTYEGHRLHRCNLLDSSGRCTLHNTGLKPLEGRVVVCSEPDPHAILRTKLCEEWESENGQRILKKYYGDEIYVEKAKFEKIIKDTIDGFNKNT